MFACSMHAPECQLDRGVAFAVWGGMRALASAKVSIRPTLGAILDVSPGLDWTSFYLWFRTGGVVRSVHEPDLGYHASTIE